jgi:cell division protein FtsQ
MKMAKGRKHRGRNHSGGRFMGLYVFLTGILVVLAILAGCIVFFKVNSVEIQVRQGGELELLSPDDCYTQEEIMEAAGIQIGDNLFLLNKNQTVIRILNRLPYVASVSIQKKLPGTLSLIVTESQPAAAVQVDKKSWWLMDFNGKLLEQTKNDGGCIQVKGLTLVEPEAGQIIEVPDGTDPDVSSQQLKKDSLLRLLSPLVDYDLIKDVKSIDLSSESELVMDYNGRIQVKMLLESDFDYQVKLLSKILTDYVDKNWTEEDSGTLDMTYSDGKTHLTRDP